MKKESGFDVTLIETELDPEIELARAKRIPSPFCLLHEEIGSVEDFFDFIYIAATKETDPHPEGNESREFKWFSYVDLLENEIKPHVKNTAIAILDYLKNH